MRLQYLGTGAAEGIPALFCQCALCREAAETGGRNVRTRAGAMLNDRILIDITPDIYLHKLKYGLDLSAVEGVVVTHSHTDHFDSGELTRRSTENYCHIKDERPFLVYGNKRVLELGRKALKLEFGKESDPSIEFHLARAYEPFVLAGVEFTPLPAVHDPEEQCFAYLIRHNGVCLLYCNDTGLWDEEAYDHLKGITLDAVSLDCTFGPAKCGSGAHMGFKENLEFIQELRARGCIYPHTRIYANHFSHNCRMNQEELSMEGKRWGVAPAFDGMVVELPGK